MTEDHEQDKPEVVDDLNEITNQLNSTALEVNQQRTVAVPTTHTSGGRLLSHVTQLATTRKDPVTFWSLPREVRDLIWSEVLGSEDDIFQANVTKSVCDTEIQVYTDPADPYATVRPARRKDGRFNKITSAPILLSSRPPLPLAHLCQESRAFALQKYDAAYSKVRGSELNQERGSRFRWLSRYAARIMRIGIPDLEYDQALLKVPLGEDERLIFDCHQYRTEGELKETKLLKDTKLLELLKKAKDYQIMICDHMRYLEPYLVDRNIAQQWGVFEDRAPGKGFAKRRDTTRKKRVFVEARDILPMGQLLRDLNRRNRRADLKSLGLRTHVMVWGEMLTTSRMAFIAPILRSGDLPYFTADGFRRLEQQELFPNEQFVTELKDRREWLQEVFSECLKPFEELWAKNVNEKDISSQSRYGRMPKIGLVLEHDISLTWSDLEDLEDDGIRSSWMYCLNGV